MASALKKRVKALEISNKKRQDFDPEDDPFSKTVDDPDDSGDESDLDGKHTGREHYEDVGTSRLRQPEKVVLDEKKYGGKAVSRAALQNGDDDDSDPFAPTGDDEDEDPFAVRDEQASDSDELDGGAEDGSSDGGLLDLDGANGDVDEDFEIDSDAAFGEGEEESFKRQGFVFRGSGKNRNQDLEDSGSKVNGHTESLSDDDLEGSDEPSDSASEHSDVEMIDFEKGDGESDDEDDDNTDISSEDEEASAKPNLRPINSEREKLKSVLFADTAAVATSLAQAASADAKKGAAVRQQYQTFDRLLDARIKLQKGFTAVNGTMHHEIDSDKEAQSAFEKAEEAAIRLYATIESLRHSIIDANTSTESSGGKKRKRPSPPTTSTTNMDLTMRMRDLEGQSLPHRRSVLDRWSNKARVVAPMSSQTTSKLNPEKQQTKLSSILDTYLLTESDKLVSQSTTATITSDVSNPTSSTSGIYNTNTTTTTDLRPITYDDTIYYQSLLRDLIASRARSNPNSSSSSTLLSSTSDILPLKLHTSGNTRRKDTKASKGRKVRYTVHEKLENFMAATGRDTGVTGQWTDAAVREFFGSLMGNRGQLDEREEDQNDGGDPDGNDVDDDEQDNREVEALRLFRS